MSARRKHQDTSRAEAFLIIVILAIIGFTCWFVADTKHNADQQLRSAATINQRSGQSSASKSNIVVDSNLGSNDLVSFLKTDDTGCWRQPSYGTGWFRIMKEVNGSQAELEYGCSKDYDQGADAPARMLVQKVNDKWEIISPTNQWLGSIPSCSMVNANDILTELEPECWSKQSSSGTTVIPTQNSQYADSYTTCLTAPGSVVGKGSPYFCFTKDGVTFEK